MGSRKRAIVVIGLFLAAAGLCSPLADGGSAKGKTTPAYRESGEPEGTEFQFPPIQIDQRVYNLGNPGISHLASRIEDGTANMIERRAWDWLYPRLYPFDKPVPDNWRLDAQRFIKKSELSRRAAGKATLTWAEVTPSTYSDGSDNDSGRATALWVDPSSNQHVIMGTANGGVWETTNLGTTWTSIFDSAATLSIGSVAVDPNNSNVIYVGTGEGNNNGDMIAGLGMYKSTDGGANWSLLTLPPWTYSSFWHSIRRIAIDPRNSNRVYAAVDGGLIYSTDAGANWSKTTCGAASGMVMASDLVLDSDSPSAGNPSIVYVAFGYHHASTANGVYRSTNGGGGTWTKISSGTGFPTTYVGRITLVIGQGSATNAKQLYALIQSTSTYQSRGIFYTSDATASSVTWTAKSTTNFCSSQCWYDMTGAVDPSDPSHLIVGGLDNYVSNNSGGSLTKVSTWYASGSSFSHADHHHMVMPNSTTVYDANDGGFFIGTINWSSKSASWVNKNAGLPTLQFYGMAQHPTDSTKIMGGLQDNGQAYFNGSTMNEVAGGDGGKSAWDQSNSSYGYEEYVYASISRNSNMTGTPTSWTCIRNFGGCNSCSGSCVPDGSCAFIAPFILDANNQNRMYTGSKYLYVNTNPRGSNSWSKLNTTDLSGGSYYIIGIHSAYNNGSAGKIFVGTASGKAWVMNNDGSSLTDISSGLSGASVTSFTTDPTNQQKVLVTLSGYGSSHVYRSSNAGSSWTDITGSLPAEPFNCIVLDPSDSNHAYAGSDYGIFENTAVWTSSTWTSIQANLPAVSMQELGFNVSNGKLRAATHGRGIWELTSSSALPNPKEASPSTDMTAAKGSGTSVNVTFTNGCGGQDNTIYTGDLSTLQSGGISWSNRYCNEGTTGTASFDPGSSDIYFVIVSNNTQGKEGSYGQGTSGERTAAGAGGSCSYTQDLTGACP